MASELHNLIEQEIAAADVRIETHTASALRLEAQAAAAERRAKRTRGCAGCFLYCGAEARAGVLYCVRLASSGLRRLSHEFLIMPRGKKMVVSVVVVCFIMMISLATVPASDEDDEDYFGTEDTVPGSMHYLLMRQGLDPEALPSVAIIGAARAGVTDLFRRLQLRYPVLYRGAFKELNFLTECQIDAAVLKDYQMRNSHCERPTSGDPLCYDCSVESYTALFNTSEIRDAMGTCAFPLRQQLVCAGGQLLPDGITRAPPAPGYSPVFTVDASKMYSGSVGLAVRSAELLAQLSPNTKLIMLLRNPADLARAVYNAKLQQECGTRECDGVDGAAYVLPYEVLLQQELQFLNQSAAAKHLLTRLANVTRPGEARLLEMHLQSNWTEYAVAQQWPPALWGKVLYSMKGMYYPIVMSWVEKFVRAGRPMLVIQAEGYFERAPDMIDDVLGPFLFGDPAGMAAFASGPPPEPATKRKYGAKAAQTVASRCMLHDILSPLNKALERLLNRYAKEGKIQLIRAKREGPLWPRPADCKALRTTTANITTVEDYDYEFEGSEPEEYQADYDYGYDFDPSGEDYDYSDDSPPRMSPPPVVG